MPARPAAISRRIVGGKQGQKKAVIPGLEDAPAGEYLTDRLHRRSRSSSSRPTRAEPFFRVPAALRRPHAAESARPRPSPTYPSLGRRAARQAGEPDLRGDVGTASTASVGRIVERAGEARRCSTTRSIIFTSDNGGLATMEGPNTPATNNSPLREGKGLALRREAFACRSSSAGPALRKLAAGGAART
jgi:arylsulfatase A